MKQSFKFWDRIANIYAKQTISDEAAYQKKLQVTQEYLKPDMEVLEFGCGTGSTAIIHAPYVQHIQAIDISQKMLAIAQKKADAEHIKNITFEHAAIDDLDVPVQSYDVVLGLSILHLLEDKEEVIARVYNMLKAGGVFVTSTVCLTDTMKFIKPMKIIAPIARFFGLMPMLNFFTRSELEKSLTDAGFQLEHQYQPTKESAVFIVAKKI